LLGEDTNANYNRCNIEFFLGHGPLRHRRAEEFGEDDSPAKRRPVDGFGPSSLGAARSSAGVAE